MGTATGTGEGRSGRELLRVTGLVQGVGFRPFVARLADELGLAGHVLNDADGVVIEVEGPPSGRDELVRRLVGEAPTAARVEAVHRGPVPPTGGRGFRIRSGPAGAAPPRTVVPPDLGLCADCDRELGDPGDRRHRHALITCAHCGPRFTIIEALPYDRERTTMAPFPMCAECAREYHDPADRRYHAQPLCCPGCGPRLWFERAGGRPRVDGDEAALAAAVGDLFAGRVVAVKGVGGYHLAVRADDAVAVARLRRRKRRGDKPFAVLARDLATARRIARIDDAEAAALSGPDRPVVLLDARADPLVSAAVAPGGALVGVMLPATGLHRLLVTDGPPVVVLTSANLAEEPIVHDDAAARERLLGPLADGLLGHDRVIRVPCDDSVVRVVDDRAVPVRRSRGHAPLPVRLPVEVSPTLAVGGDLKGAVCLASGRDAWMSQHLGDMDSLAALDALERTVAAMTSFHRVRPEITVADLHPRYRSRRWALDRDPGTIGVQHHLAHVASVMAEHGVDPDTVVTGVAFDGTGYGSDGTVWGGELLAGTYATLRRVAHLAARPLPGGDAAVHRPDRVAVALLLAAGLDPAEDLAPVRSVGREGLGLLRRMVGDVVHVVPCTSMGRLFDAVASLLDLCHEADFEAQAAMALEAAARRRADPVPELCFDLDDAGVASPDRVLRGLVDGLAAGLPVTVLAAAFHAAVADLVLSWAERLGHPTVALSGGVFQNAVLLHACGDRLAEAGFRVLTHRVVPPNDGGLALGQVVLAAAGNASVGGDRGAAM